MHGKVMKYRNPGKRGWKFSKTGYGMQDLTGLTGSEQGD
jgi:hypothetical protein